MSRRTRGTYTSNTHPEPPAKPVAIATNSLRQRSTDPKSRVSAWVIISVGLPSPNAMLAKYSSWRSVELSAISSSRFQAVDHITRRIVEVERLELLRDCVQPPESPAVVIFVVALDEPQRQTIEQPRTSVDRCQLVSHVHSSRWNVKCCIPRHSMSRSESPLTVDGLIG